MDRITSLSINNHGKFIVSLDFELIWGVRHKKTIKTYGKNILGVSKVIPQVLELFRHYNIQATFAIVGFLFFKNKQELIDSLPKYKPRYKDGNLSPYNNYFDNLGADFKIDPYHYAPSLIKLIQEYHEHEIGTHTFSHYYCLEQGQTMDMFREDLWSAIGIAEKWGIRLSSLIFPKNQCNDDYLQICKEMGIICYRGNQRSWLYTAKGRERETLFRRMLRFIDAYIPISGHNCYLDKYPKDNFPVDIPASRFLRPFSKKLRLFEGLRLIRIKSDMNYAAKHNMTYHLWWHPHNFGVNQNENFSFLEKILKYYQYLNKKYGFKSYTMTMLAESLNS
jgi:peptidoglycan/xylan/chitin deacetylase (PgdA/CDA1 family)